MRISNSRAFSISEFLVFTLITGSLIAALSTTVRSINKTCLNILSKEEKSAKLETTFRIINNSVLINTTNPYLNKHFWHLTPEAPSYVKSRLQALNTKDKPIEDGIILELSEMVQVQFYLDDKSNSFIGVDNGNKLLKERIRAWISFYPDTTYRLKINSNPKFIKNSSYKISLNQAEIEDGLEMFGGNSPKDKWYPRLIIAIADHFVVYSSEENILRRVSLLSPENQPLVKDVILKKNNQDECTITLPDSETKKTFICLNVKNSYKRAYALDL